MKFAPIVLFVYNRADTAKKVLFALDKNPEASCSQLYIYSDGAKNEEGKKAVNEVRSMIKEYSKKSRFRSVNIIEQPENRGLVASIISGVSEVIDKFGEVIVIEDDCVPSECFLNFMNRALKYYENDLTVGSISGWTPNLRFPDEYTADVLKILRSCSYCWGTWKRCWDIVDWDMKEYDSIRNDRKMIRNVCRTGSDRFYRYIRKKKYNIQSWSVLFGVSLVNKGLYTIYPRYSFSENIGHDGRGTHDDAEEVAVPFKVTSEHCIKDTKMEDVSSNKSIEKQFAKIYGGTFYQRIFKWLYIHGGEPIIDRIRKR